MLLVNSLFQSIIETRKNFSATEHGINMGTISY